MHLVEKSSSDEEEMTERYYDAFSTEEMNKLAESNVCQDSDDADRQVQEEETEEQYFDAYSHEELIRKKKTNISKRKVGQELEVGDFEESSGDIWIPPDQRERESVDTQMSESQSEMHNPEYSSFGEQGTFLGNRTPFDNNLTESQDDTDNPENSSSVEEEEEKYFDSNLPKDGEESLIDEVNDEKILDDVSEESMDMFSLLLRERDPWDFNPYYWWDPWDYDPYYWERVKNELSKMRSVMKNEISNMRSVMTNKFSKMRSDLEEDFNWMRISNIIHAAGINVDDTNGREMSVGKQRMKIAFILIGTLSFASTVCPCAGEIDLGSSQPKIQDHSQIYQQSLKYVSKCPNSSEYMYKTLEKCAIVCGNNIQNGSCAYHCIRDSSKTKLVEFCAKPKIFFEYCPEYDPEDQTIQKDQATLCNSKFPRSYYKSSDIYFCDPNNCLKIYGSSDRSGETTLSTLMTGTTEMNQGKSHQVWSLQNLILMSFVASCIVVAISIVWICPNFGIFSPRPRNKNNSEDVEKTMMKEEYN